MSAGDTRTHIFGNLKIPGFIIDTEGILKDTSGYFLNLLGLGVLDISTWRNLTDLKNRNNSEGNLSINDVYYYEHKNISVLDPLEDLERFDQFEHQFNVFMSRPMKLHTPAPVLFNLLKFTVQKKNHADIKAFLSYYQFDYAAIRKDKEFKKTLDPKQHQLLMDALSGLNSFSDLYRSVAEFKVMDKTDSVKGTFAALLEYFFGQSPSIFDFENPAQDDKCFTEKIARATLWLDLILCICEHSIPCSFARMLAYDLAHKNFVKSCEMELSVLADSHSLHMMMLFDCDSLELIMKKISQLRSNPFYKRYYSRIMDKYLNLGHPKKT